MCGCDAHHITTTRHNHTVGNSQLTMCGADCVRVGEQAKGMFFSKFIFLLYAVMVLTMTARERVLAAKALPPFTREPEEVPLRLILLSVCARACV